VVAIIALLTAVLLPSLARARESARKTMCLSHLHQQGVGFAGYSADHKARLPWAGSFAYSLMEGKYYLSFQPPAGHDWTLVNSGALYPRYVGKNAEVFYCPSNLTFSASNPDNGLNVFLQRYAHPKSTDPGYQNSHTFPISPFSSYAYAVPAAVGRHPRDAGRDTYPLEVVETNWPCSTVGPNCPKTPYHQYLNDPSEPDPQFLGRFPQVTRGRHAIPALLTDAYATDENVAREVKGYHGGGFNVLFSDFHAKWVVDPGGVINRTDIPMIRSGYPGIDKAQLYIVWDYLSRNR
jgi:prepilin-type processing-associated H-X9-DG protein